MVICVAKIVEFALEITVTYVEVILTAFWKLGFFKSWRNNKDFLHYIKGSMNIVTLGYNTFRQTCCVVLCFYQCEYAKHRNVETAIWGLFSTSDEHKNRLFLACRVFKTTPIFDTRRFWPNNSYISASLEVISVVIIYTLKCLNPTGIVRGIKQ